ncbi:methylated-DNA--[protein]-cysteine S-methyltransferase [Acidobacteriota bacterium]
MKKYRTYYNSKIGLLEITGTSDAVTSINFTDKKQAFDRMLPENLKECRTQLDEYFRGKRTDFSVKFKLEGTDFQKKVWKRLLKIPHGQTVSYKDVAVGIGNEKGVRAVGGATGRNNISIIVPCHRVIGSGGDLVGFGGGLWRKVWLLNHEKPSPTVG